MYLFIGFVEGVNIVRITDDIKRYRKEYYKSHREEIIKKVSEWNKNQKEKREIIQKRYRNKNRKVLKEKNVIWCNKNKNVVYEIHKKWSKTPSGIISQRKKHKKYLQTEKGKISNRRSSVKRNRELGFNPLNEWFNKSHAHHINRTDVIFIPHKIHKIIYHCVYTNRNMEIINTYAFFFLLQQNMEKISEYFSIVS